MVKYWKYILLTVSGIVLYNILKAGSMSNKFVRFTNMEALKLLALQSSLTKVGFKLPQLNFALAQLLFETGKFTRQSQVAANNNNYSGIKWINSSRQNATKGTLVPLGERVSDPNSPLNYYAHFNNMDDWATDFKRIISLQRSANNIGKPIDANTLDQYIHRLKLNQYFGDSENVYYNGAKKYLDMFGT